MLCILEEKTKNAITPSQVVLAINDFEVIPSESVSPLTRYLLGWEASGTFQFRKTADAMHPAAFQALRGFAGVPEAALTKLMTELDLEVPEHLQIIDCSTHDKLALCLMVHYLPDLDSTSLGHGTA